MTGGTTSNGNTEGLAHSADHTGGPEDCRKEQLAHGTISHPYRVLPLYATPRETNRKPPNK